MANKDKEWETTSFFFSPQTVRCEASLIVLVVHRATGA
jgi:hypothetical protein